MGDIGRSAYSFCHTDYSYNKYNMRKQPKPDALNTIKRCAAIHIIKVVCDHYGLEPKIVFSKTVKPKYLEARQSTIYLLFELGLSLREIESVVGVKYHGAYKHWKRVKDIISVDKEYSDKIGVFHFSITQSSTVLPTLYKNDEADGKTEEICE